LAKVKVDIRGLRKQLKGIRNEWQKEASKTAEPVLKKAIIEENILRGKSPVQGEGRFEKYSVSYRWLIRARLSSFGKRATPVNLKLSGQMLSTFSVKEISKGLSIGFSDIIARYHNDGGGNLPERRLLPTRPSERFNRSINMSIKGWLESSLKKVIARRGR